MRILFVCGANMHRSPLAEAMLRDRALGHLRDDLTAASCGVHAIDGAPALSEAIDLAREAGLDLTSHRSRRLDEEMLRAADRILVMERQHLAALERTEPASLPRAALLGAFAGPDAGIDAGEEIPDAIGEGMDAFRRTFRILRDCVGRLYEDLPPPPQELYARAIEQRFRRRRGTPLTISPRDFSLVESWWRRGVPLWMVLDAIDHLFRQKEASGDPGRVRGLSFCTAEVEERMESFTRARTPAGATPSEAPADRGDADARRTLAEAAALLLEAAGRAREAGEHGAADVLERTARAVPAPPGPGGDTAATRLALHRLEEDLAGALREATSAARLARLGEEAAARLADHRERMTPQAFDATVARLVGERILDDYGVPRLGSI